MGRCFLPIDDMWAKYKHNCVEAFDDLTMELYKILKRLAAANCRLAKDRRYEEGY